MAHARGVTVEGELGCLGSLETMRGDKEDGHGTEATMTREQLLTDPEQAADFVKKTQLDALAIAIGTSHGAYKFTRKPTGDILAIDRIKEIHRRIPNTHLVMHGSSSVPQDLLAEIRKYGGSTEGDLRRAGRGDPGSDQARRAQDQHRHRHPPGDDRRRSASTWPRTRRSSTRATTSSRRARRPSGSAAALPAVRLRRPGGEDRGPAADRRSPSATRRASWRRRSSDGGRSAAPGDEPQPLFESTIRSLPLLARGKVRDNYAVGSDRLLMVASDRLSAFDVVMGEPIPGKGQVLTQMALFWFDQLGARRAQPPHRRRSRERGRAPTSASRCAAGRCWSSG